VGEKKGGARRKKTSAHGNDNVTPGNLKEGEQQPQIRPLKLTTGGVLGGGEVKGGTRGSEGGVDWWGGIWGLGDDTWKLKVLKRKKAPRGRVFTAENVQGGDTQKLVEVRGENIRARFQKAAGRDPSQGEPSARTQRLKAKPPQP